MNAADRSPPPRSPQFRSGARRPTLARGVARGALLSAWCALCTVHAEDAVPLSRSEATQLVVGKKVTYLRVRDNATIAWDFRPDGTVYYQTSNTTRQAIPSGTYTIDDEGATCLKWNPDRHNALTDSCVVFKRDGDRIVITGKRSGTVTGTLVDAP